MPATYEMEMSSVRLSPGRNGLSRARVAELQRSRLIAALMVTVAEVGYTELTVGKILSRARVSRKTFYHVFDDREDCFLAGFEEVIARTRRMATGAYAEEA